MSIESLVSLTSSEQHDIFIDLEEFLSKNGFEKIPPEILVLERRVTILSEPTQKRQKEGDQCPVFRKPFMSGYFLEVIPRFNQKTKTFTENGQITVHVKTIYKHKRVFGIYFKKWDGVKERVETVTGFLLKVLQNHPRNQNGEYMPIVRSEKNKWNIYFVDPDFPRSISKRKKIWGDSFLNLFPAKREAVLEIFEGRTNYVANKPQGVQDLSDIVHRRSSKKPQKSAVQVGD
jgi:hypothetical protein